MKTLRKIGLKLAMFDGLWSFPLTVFGFWLIGFVMQSWVGLAAGSYDIAFFQLLFLAIGIVIGAMNASVLGLWFGLRGFYRFIYGTKANDGKYINPSKEEWKKLTSCQKFAIAFFVLFSYFWAVIIVYLKLV